MTERRQHWDDELIESLPIPGHSYLEDEDIYAIIAAVEDWHEKFVMHGAFRVLAERAASAEADRDRLANQLLNEVPDSYIQMKARALTAEATIQRVRDACVSSHVDDKGKRVVFLDRIQRALDGDGDA